MRRKQNRLASVLQFQNDVPYLPAAHRVEAGHRLVENHQLRVVQNRLGQPNSLQHTLRIFSQLNFSRRLQSYFFQHRLYALVALRCAEPVKPREVFLFRWRKPCGYSFVRFCVSMAGAVMSLFLKKRPCLRQSNGSCLVQKSVNTKQKRAHSCAPSHPLDCNCESMPVFTFQSAPDPRKVTSASASNSVDHANCPKSRFAARTIPYILARKTCPLNIPVVASPACTSPMEFPDIRVAASTSAPVHPRKYTNTARQTGIASCVLARAQHCAEIH